MSERICSNRSVVRVRDTFGPDAAAGMPADGGGASAASVAGIRAARRLATAAWGARLVR